MANTVVLTSVSRLGDSVTARGTVNGGPEIAVTSWASYLSTFGTDALKRTYIAALLVSASQQEPVEVKALEGTVEV